MFLWTFALNCVPNVFIPQFKGMLVLNLHGVTFAGGRPWHIRQVHQDFQDHGLSGIDFVEVQM